MTELEKIAYAKSFIDKLANGINPIDDQPVSENDVVNNVRLKRCFFYVSDILKQVIEHGGIQEPHKVKKSTFTITQEQLYTYPLSEKPIPVSEIARNINSLIDTTRMKSLSHRDITNWLISVDVLCEQSNLQGRAVKRPTEAGKQLGITLDKRTGKNGEYYVVVYDQTAQSFILDNIDAIIGSKNEKQAPLCEFQGRPWTEAHDECLIDLFKKNVSVSEIAVTLKRTDRGIQARLKKLGLIENRSDAN